MTEQFRCPAGGPGSLTYLVESTLGRENSNVAVKAGAGAAGHGVPAVSSTDCTPVAHTHQARKPLPEVMATASGAPAERLPLRFASHRVRALIPGGRGLGGGQGAGVSRATPLSGRGREPRAGSGVLLGEWLWDAAARAFWRVNWPQEEVFKGPAVRICLSVTSGDRVIPATVVSVGACACCPVLLEFWLCFP